VRELRIAVERAVILADPAIRSAANTWSFIPRDRNGEVVLRFNSDPNLEQA
jgi:hypothetical protein